MSNTEHSVGGRHRSFRCTFGPAREVDLVWPPTDEDIEAFSVVHLDESDAQPPRVEPPLTEPAPPEAARPEPVRVEPVQLEPVRVEPRWIKPTFGDCRARGAAPRVRPLVVPMEPRPLPGPALPDAPALPEATAGVPLVVPEDARVPDVPADDVTAAATEASPLPPLPISAATLPPDAETIGARQSAWLAVFFAAACALVTVAEYRRVVTLPADATEAPPVPTEVSVANVPAPNAPAVLPAASPKPAPPRRTAAAPPARPIPAPSPKVARAPAPAPPVPRVTVDVRDRGVVAAAKVEPRVAPAGRPEPQPALAARVEVPPPPPPAPVAAAAAPARPEPLARAAPPPPVMSTPAGAAPTDTASDEAGIQSTLARFRTAYSQLNASAARDVWPSVDARALERAFQSLKSQDLRFDSCKMTVTGARAQAACKGRAVYVPRIGDQSPRFTSREWNFELRKADERWTIASARSL
jgi:hypothetical protein